MNGGALTKLKKTGIGKHMGDSKVENSEYILDMLIFLHVVYKMLFWVYIYYPNDECPFLEKYSHLHMISTSNN